MAYLLTIFKILLKHFILRKIRDKSLRPIGMMQSVPSCISLLFIHYSLSLPAAVQEYTNPVKAVFSIPCNQNNIAKLLQANLLAVAMGIVSWRLPPAALH